jgi:hypothetical protein
MEDYLNSKDAAKFLGVSVSTLHKWERSGILAAEKNGRGHKRYLPRDLAMFVPPKTYRHQKLVGSGFPHILEVCEQLNDPILCKMQEIEDEFVHRHILAVKDFATRALEADLPETILPGDKYLLHALSQGGYKLTTDMAAQYCGCSWANMMRALRAGDVIGKKYGYLWMLDVDSVIVYELIRQRVGSKRRRGYQERR